jgi:hypothetical protein
MDFAEDNKEDNHQWSCHRAVCWQSLMGLFNPSRYAKNRLGLLTF